jgi:hypothetical protein
MSNLFQEVLTHPNGMDNKLLISRYPYDKNIKTTRQIGMSDDGNSQQMSKDIDGLIKYMELLVNGKSTASARELPLGNKILLKTGAIDGCSDQINVSTRKDNTLNPFEFKTELLSGTNQQCQQISMQTITNDNIQSSEKHYVTLSDITGMEPSTFEITSEPQILIPDDPLAQFYFAGLGALGLFMLYRLMEKAH